MLGVKRLRGCMSIIEDKVCQKIQLRAEVGLSKYGVTVERTDLTKREWLVHLQEELMDSVVYVTRIIDELDNEAKNI